MAYNEYQAERIRRVFKEKNVPVQEKKMMGGLCFMVDDKMCCGLTHNKTKKLDLLMARIGIDAYEDSLKKEGALPMDFTGRPMKGFIFVDPNGFDLEEDLTYWIEKCLAYNPIAKSSKKKV